MPITHSAITVTQASQQTRISKRTIQDAIARGDLPAIKGGVATAAYWIDQADLDIWAAARRKTNRGEQAS